ncbi:MAG: WbqC family protein [Bacteroidota bacterium]
MEESAGTGSLRSSEPTVNSGCPLLPCFYLPPLVYFSVLSGKSRAQLEVHENYSKQTYRNRTLILGANGPLVLSIPVVKISGKKQLMKDVCIDYSTPWQKLHWKGIESAYAGSPFFEYYRDDFEPFYRKRKKYLADLNEAILNTVLKLIGFELELVRSLKYQPGASEEDLRSCISPKKDISTHNPWFHSLVYHQVFQDRTGFIPDLGILDLLFNEGPHAPEIIKKTKAGL